MSNQTNITLPISSSVLRQIKRLKGTIPDQFNEKKVNTIVGERVLSPAIALFIAIQWDKDRIYYVDDNMHEPRIDWSIASVEEELAVGCKEPLFMIASTSLQYCILVKVDDFSDNPMVYKVDHDGSDPLQYEQSLSKFLTSLKTMTTKKPSGKKKQFLEALNTRNTDDLIQCLKKGASVEAFDSSGFSPLHYAAAGRNISSVAALLEAGADPNAKIMVKEILFGYKYRAHNRWRSYTLQKGDCPLLLSLNKQCGVWYEEKCIPELVKLLLEAGADPNNVNRYGATPLSHTTNYDKDPSGVKVLKMLLEAGADPNLLTRSDRTPLVRAVEAKNEAFFELLVAAKADPHIRKEIHGKLPLSAAVREGAEWVKKVLAIGADPNFLSTTRLKNVKKTTAMHMAIAQNKSDCLKILVEAGGNPNLRTPEGSLLDFTQEHNKEMVKVLKDLGAVDG